MKFGIVYHRIDFDGLMSYAIAREAIERKGGEVVAFPYNHNDPVPCLEGLDGVYVVDIALPVEVMREQAHRFVWVDHHITSIRDSELNGYANLPGRRCVGKGACELSWEYFNPGKPMPEVVKLLSTYDVFDKHRPGLDWEKTVLPFQWGMRKLYGLDAERLFSDFATGAFHHLEVEAIIAQGKVLLDFVRENGARSANAYGFEVKVGWEGHRVLAILTDNFGSIPYEETARIRGYEAVMCLGRVGDDAYKVSIYAGANGKASFDIGTYLKDHYAGGGHKDAGGCVVNTSTFMRILTKNVF